MVVQSISQTIHRECNKPLQSKWYVETKNKSKYDWKFHQSPTYTVRSNKAGNMWFVRDRKQTISDTERKQWELYRQLKRKYNQEQRQLKKQADEIEKQKIELAKEKTRATAYKKNIQLLSGLASAPRYDRIYANA